MLNIAAGIALRFLALQFNFRPALKKYMKSVDGWINFSVGFITRSTRVEQAIIFHNGRVRVTGKIPDNADVTLRFHTDDILLEMACSTPNEMLNLILENFKTLHTRWNMGDIPVLPRIPLIPGITDTRENVASVIAWFKTLGVTKTRLIPYHPVWMEKNRRLGIEAGDRVLPGLTTWPAPGTPDRFNRLFRRAGIETI